MASFYGKDVKLWRIAGAISAILTKESSFSRPGQNSLVTHSGGTLILIFGPEPNFQVDAFWVISSRQYGGLEILLPWLIDSVRLGRNMVVMLSRFEHEFSWPILLATLQLDIAAISGGKI